MILTPWCPSFGRQLVRLFMDADLFPAPPFAVDARLYWFPEF
jgi:hypothetical protein